ncbi:unnamed protein product [Lactuca saligna]|uniref:MULE transposase domain-containing protein n=1 Tax=Lactuca saligna TaxID=75948 RepID=A0AA35YTC7_LACSI|nr:unnamed protein product [Lactuca saligna]
MAAAVLRDFNLKVSFGQCRNAKKIAMDEIEGSLVAHYEKLRSYGLELLRTNPGSTVKLDVDIMPDSTVHFSKMYICLKAVKDGWIEGCRRVIGVDGCFLQGLCRGEVVLAVGRDANNQMYPLAWAVVPVENKANWKWFLDLLLEDIDMGQGRGLTIISDQHKGLIEAVKERVPECEHRQCARHVYANFKKKFSGAEYRKLFWEDSGSDAIENGVSESFNAAIVEARKKPIIAMLEDIKVWLNEVYAVDLHKRTCGCRSWKLTGHNKRKCPLKQLNAVDDSDLFDYHELFEGEGQGQGQGQGEGQGQDHEEAEEVRVDLEDEVGGDSGKEVEGDSEDDLEMEVEQLVDEEVVNHHVVAPTLKRRKCGPSQRNIKLRLRRKVVTKDDTGGSLENPVTL